MAATLRTIALIYRVEGLRQALCSATRLLNPFRKVDTCYLLRRGNI